MADRNVQLHFLPASNEWASYSLLTTFLLTVFFVAIPVKTFALGTPLNPSSPDEIIITFENKLSPEMSELREQLKMNPKDEKVAKQLITAYLDLSKLTGDERYLGYGMSIINRWSPEFAPENILLLKARVIQRQHHFSEALTILKRVVDLNPRSGEAHLLASYIYMAQGELDLARRSCAKAGPLLGAMEGLVCASRIQGLSGQGEKAFQILRLILGEAADAVDPAYTNSYLNLAEIATRLGKQEAAEKYYRFVLNSSESESSKLDAKTVSGLVDLLLVQGRYKESINLLGLISLPSSVNIPLPLTAIQLVLTKEALGESVNKERDSLKRYFELEKTRNENYASRDYSRYLLEITNNAEQAFTAALKNWETQREPDDLLILIKSASSIGESERVSDAIKWRNKWGLEDVRIDKALQTLN